MQQQRDAKVAKGRRRLPLRVAQTPELVAVEVDGGRLRTRAADAGAGVHEQENKEDKIACLITLQGKVSTENPQAEPPPSFLQPRRVERLVREMAGQARAVEETAAASVEATFEEEVEKPAAASDPSKEPWAPRKQLRSCIASMANSKAFGRMVAVEA